MKLTDRLYHWFYKSDKNNRHPARISTNILRGASASFMVWVFSLLFDRLIGLDGTSYWYLPHFVTGGMIIGAVIGMISNEVLWHKEKTSHVQTD